MVKMTKPLVLKAVAKVGKTFAVLGSGSASLFGFHQPKEPTALRKALKK